MYARMFIAGLMGEIYEKLGTNLVIQSLHVVVEMQVKLLMLTG